MIIRKIDANGDWRFGKGLADYATEEAAIEENVQTRVLSWLYDCFFDLEEGIDWRSRLDVGDKTDLEAEVRKTILQSFGVVGVNSVIVTYVSTTRLYRIEYSIDTIYSQSFQSVIEQTVGGI